MLSKVLCVAVLGACAADDPAEEPPREPTVIVDAFPGGVLIYQGDDGSWQRVPAFGDRFGFDVTERYAVGYVDRDQRVVDILFATVADQTRVSWPVAPTLAPAHQITGMAAGIGKLPGRAASSLETVALRADEPYALTVSEGSNTLAFGQLDEETGRIRSVILERDLPVVADQVIDVDFGTAGLRTSVAQVRVAQGGTCHQRSVFTFDGTSLLLDTNSNALTFPHASQWEATDRLTFEIDCSDGPNNRATLFREIAREHLVPTEIEAPVRMGPGSKLSRVDEGWHFTWQPYFYLTHQYELTISCATCARWTSRMTERWLQQASFLDLDVFSPPDLAALGLLDPSLDMPDAVEWSITAHVRDGDRRVDATQSGRLQ